MRLSPIQLKPAALACICSFWLIVGCDKSVQTPDGANNAPTTQPTAMISPSTTQPAEANAEPAEPTGSMLEIAQLPQWFPPARLRLSVKDGKVIARLYSDDPREVLTGKATVNSYDLRMVLTDISDPADIARAQYFFRSASMEKQDTPYGISLNNQQDVLQPMNVKVAFEGQAPRVKVLIQGTFSRFHMSDLNPNPAPTTVSVLGFLDAKVTEKE